MLIAAMASTTMMSMVVLRWLAMAMLKIVVVVMLLVVVAVIAVWVRDVGGWVGGSKLRWAEACLHPHLFYTHGGRKATR